MVWTLTGNFVRFGKPINWLVCQVWYKHQLTQMFWIWYKMPCQIWYSHQLTGLLQIWYKHRLTTMLKFDISISWQLCFKFGITISWLLCQISYQINWLPCQIWYNHQLIGMLQIWYKCQLTSKLLCKRLECIVSMVNTY